MNNKAIGVFDSGIGGLTVVREIIRELPQERIIYLGDTARVPYGTRGVGVIQEFAMEMVEFLLKQEVKFLVVACNTISATCLEEIIKLSPVPVIGVIKPAAKQIAQTTKTKTVGIIGTRATINSQAYIEAVKEIDSEIKILTKACPLFVPIAEEGLGKDEIGRLAAREYLAEMAKSEMDVLHLGCTHYPLLREVIQEVVGDGVTIIDSAKPTVVELKLELKNRDLLSDGLRSDHQFFVTDAPERVKEAAGWFLGEDIAGRIKKVEL